MTSFSCLLPAAAYVRLETCTLDPAHSTIAVTPWARRMTAPCPLCGSRAKRVHSRCQRTLADLPWANTLSPSCLVCAGSIATMLDVGAAGIRLGRKLGLNASHNTLLCLI